MAYAAVASLSETIHVILKYHQHYISPQFENQTTHLQKLINFLRSFIEESPDEAQSWEGRIGEVANKAEDIIELLLSDSLLDSLEPKLKKPSYDFDKLEGVTAEMESIVRGVRERHRETVVSFNDESQQIIDGLCGGSLGLQVISIVGSGGIGKTTLARNVYNHPLIVEHFETRAWVTISQNYSMREILSGLLSSSRTSVFDKIKLVADDVLFARLVHFLGDRRYLIVLDDLWSAEVWDQLESRIPHNSNGSRVLVTTRLNDVATCVGSYTHVHQMRALGVDPSWDLLRQKIFEQDPCPPKLELVGKMIAGSCRGLPLAIEVVSGILAAHLTPATWEDIAEDLKINCIHCQDSEHILHILGLSYTYLPHHLRPCFLYLGMFPEDHQIRVSKLVKLWEAEGFVNESEETGEEYLEELVKRRLVSASNRNKYTGRMKKVRIHDLVWDFCTRQAQIDYFFLHHTKFLVAAEAIQLQRRVSVADCDNILKYFYGSTVRTLICLEDNEKGIQRRLEYFRLLRVLDLSEGLYLFFKGNEFPSQVFEQFHLRYLAFSLDRSLSRLRSIPKAISKLENLQTLIIQPGGNWIGIYVIDLPSEIWRMRRLRHVVVFSCVIPLPSQEEEATFALQNLQTLNEVVDFICSRETLEMIPNLTKLGLWYIEWGYYELHNLIYLQKLETLKIRGNWPQSYFPVVFPPTLKRLSLSGLTFVWEYMDSLPNLQELKLRNCHCIDRKWETNEGGFSQLNFLLIKRSNLKHWITKSSHFPRLKWLVLRECPYLTEIPNDIGHIQTLELIEVDQASTTLLASAKRIVEDQQSLGNYSLQFRALPI